MIFVLDILDILIYGTEAEIYGTEAGNSTSAEEVLQIPASLP